MQPHLLTIDNLSVIFPSRHGETPAVRGVSFTLEKGEMLALVGESGSGKSVTALSILGLTQGAKSSGSVRFSPSPPAGEGWGGGEESFTPHSHPPHPTLPPQGGKEQELLHAPESVLQPLRGKRIAMIFQEPMTALNPLHSVGKQLRECLALHQNMTRAEQDARIAELLAEVGLGEGMGYRGQGSAGSFLVLPDTRNPKPDTLLSRYPHQLSGGQRQRVMIAMAIANDPEILIADEPTTAIDVTLQVQILALLKKLQRERGMAILLITHDLHLVRRMADRVAVMKAGEIVEQGPVATVFDQGPGVRGQGSGSKNGNQQPTFAETSADTLTTSRFPDPRPLTPAPFPHHPYTLHLLSSAPTGTAVPLAADAPRLLTAEHVSVRFPIKTGIFRRVTGHFTAVEDVSFTLHAGETLGIVGESGSGKTTLALALLGLVGCTGNVSFALGRAQERERAVSPRSGAPMKMQEAFSGCKTRNFRAHAQIVFQDPFGSLNPRMNIEEIVGEGLTIHAPHLTADERRTRVVEILGEVGLGEGTEIRDQGAGSKDLNPQPATSNVPNPRSLPPDPFLNRYPHEFSGGQRQRISIARAMILKPKLVVLDEPTSALDVSVQAQVLDLLKSLQIKHGLSYLFISHDLRIVRAISHRVLVMKNGRVVESGATEQIFENPRENYTKSLIDAAFLKGNSHGGDS